MSPRISFVFDDAVNTDVTTTKSTDGDRHFDLEILDSRHIDDLRTVLFNSAGFDVPGQTLTTNQIRRGTLQGV